MKNSTLDLSASPAPVDDKIFRLDVDESLQSLFYAIYSYLKRGIEVPRNLVELKFKELLFNTALNPKHKSLAQFLSSLNQTTKAALDDVMMKNFQHDLELDEFALSVSLKSNSVSILDDWDTMGMRATGSQTLAFDKVFISDAAIVLARPRNGFHPVWDMALTVAMPRLVRCMSVLRKGQWKLQFQSEKNTSATNLICLVK